MSIKQIKNPFLRTRSVATILDKSPDDLITFYADLQAYGSRLPYGHLITDFCISGSYARECARLGSDIDIIIETGTEENRLLARELIKQNAVMFGAADHFMKSLWAKYGLRIEVALKYATVAETPESYLSLRDMQYFSKEKRRIAIDYETKEITFLPEKPENQHFELKKLNEATNEWFNIDPIKDDPWKTTVAKYQSLYGPEFYVVGQTPDTAYLNDPA